MPRQHFETIALTMNGNQLTPALTLFQSDQFSFAIFPVLETTIQQQTKTEIVDFRYIVVLCTCEAEVEWEKKQNRKSKRKQQQSAVIDNWKVHVLGTIHKKYNTHCCMEGTFIPQILSKINGLMNCIIVLKLWKSNILNRQWCLHLLKRLNCTEVYWFDEFDSKKWIESFECSAKCQRKIQ